MRRFELLALAAFWAAAVGVQAAETRFVVTVPGHEIASFALPLPSAPDYSAPAQQAAFSNVSGTWNGLPATFLTVQFYPLDGLGGLYIYNGGRIILDEGDVLYTGPESGPVFTPGSYSEIDGESGVGGTVTVSVPEPRTWALLIVGLGSIGLRLRRLPRVAVDRSARLWKSSLG